MTLNKQKSSDSLKNIPITAPTSGDDGKVFAYDSASNSFKWVTMSSGGGGGSVTVYNTLADLQAAIPNGSASPAWVIADNSWYYWAGAVVPDTTPPIVTINPIAGTYALTQSVTLSANETATIYYTTNGSTPTTSSSVYSTPISVPATTTLKYFGKDTAGNSSAVQTALFTIDAGATDTTPPIVNISPAAGTYSSTQSVTLSATDNSGGSVTIYYTTDGSTPTQSSSVYSSPISVPATATIKYFGKDPSGNVSIVQSATYTISAGTAYVSSGLVHQYDNLTTNSTVSDDGTYIPATGDFTLYLVFKHSGYQNFMDHYELGVPTNSQYRIYEEDFGGFTLSANFWNGSNVDTIRGTTDLTTLGTSLIHGAVVRSGNNVKVYTNNVQQGSGTLSASTMNTSNKQIHIGNASTNTRAIYLYNRALNTTELTQNFTNIL